MRKLSFFHICVVAVLIAVLLAPQMAGGAAPGKVSAPSTPITVTISVNAAGGKGATAEVVCQVSSQQNINNVTVKMTAKGGAAFLTGNAWTSSLAKGSTSTFSASVALNKEGNMEVTCSALGPNNKGTRWGDMKTYYFNVSASSITQGWTKTSTAGKAQLLSAEVPVGDFSGPDDHPAPSAAAGAPEEPGTQGTVCYYGYWYFYDRGTYLPPADPATAASKAKFTLRPLQWASIFLYDNDYGAGDDYLGSAITDENGYWSRCVTNPQADGDIIDLYFRAYMSNSWWVVSTGVTGGGATYNWVSGTYSTTPTSGNFSVGAWYIPTSGNYMAAWLHDDLNQAIYYFRSPRRYGAPAEGPTIEQGYAINASIPAYIKWSPSSTDGTYYSFGDDTIHLAGNDPRTYSASIHEYGHRVMNLMYPADDWPNGFGNCPSPHYYNGVSGQSCAFSEGWADAVSILVPNDPLYRWASGSTANNETRAGFAAGDAVEGNVAAVFWDWIDVNNEGVGGTYYDQVQFPTDSFFRAIDIQNDDKFQQYWLYLKAQNGGWWCSMALSALKYNINSAGYTCP